MATGTTRSHLGKEAIDFLIYGRDLTVPKALKGQIKRPDFLVGIPSIGTLAFDVKAKTVYDNHILIDAYEHRTLLNFETYFSIAVWYICFPPDDPTSAISSGTAR